MDFMKFLLQAVGGEMEKNAYKCYLLYNLCEAQNVYLSIW